MAFTGTVRGADELRRAARQLRSIAHTHMQREIRGASKSTVDELLPPLLRASALAHAPSGYGPTLAQSLKLRTSAKLATSSQVRIQVTIYGTGLKEHRDVKALDRGILRHKVFGHSDRWVVQAIPPGFADRPATALRTPLVRRIDTALSQIAERFNNGGVGL